ncbi:MAG: hypothetical protein WBN61_07000 [Woeseiaceae bacterium]
MKYDDASWHYGGDFPSESPAEYGGTHIGIFLKWCFIKGWAGELHTEEENDVVHAVIRGEMSGTVFLFKYCDGKLTDEDFNNEGNDVASEHYDSFSMDAYCYLFPHQMYVAPESAHDVGKLFQQLDKKAAKNP